MNEIAPQELKRMQDAKERFLLIDVREPYEAERCSIGGTLIPTAAAGPAVRPSSMPSPPATVSTT